MGAGRVGPAAGAPVLVGPWSHRRGDRQGPAAGSVCWMKPEPPEPPGSAAQRPRVLCPVGDTGSGVLAVPGTLGGFAEPRLPGGLRRSPPRSSGWHGLGGQPAPLGEQSAGTRGSVFFRLGAGALALLSLVLQCRLGGQRANSSRPGKGGARRSRGFADAPREPPQLATFSVFFPGDATPPEDTGDIGFC